MDSSGRRNKGFSACHCQPVNFLNGSLKLWNYLEVKRTEGFTLWESPHDLTVAKLGMRLLLAVPQQTILLSYRGQLHVLIV